MKPDCELLRTDFAQGLELGSDSVDLKTGTIGGASIMQLGRLKDDRFEVDDLTLEQLTDLGNGSKLGAKIRFGHPSMSDDALGTFLGRAKNFRRIPGEDRTRADLFFDPTSFATPSGDLGGYVLRLAKSDPDAFGISVAVQAEGEPQVNESGTGVTDEGGMLPPLLRLQSLVAADVVDSPAATNGLFGMNAQTMLSAELYQHLEALMQRPDFVKRAYVFFTRAFDALEPGVPKAEPALTNEEEGAMPTPIETAPQTLAEFTKQHAEHIGTIQDAARAEGVGDERARALEIVKFAQDVPCDVSKELLSAIDEGLSTDKAQSNFLRVELNHRDAEANEPTGLKGDSMPETETFTSYEEAWKNLKRIEGLSTSNAMRAAQDRYPELYKQYLATLPRGKA